MKKKEIVELEIFSQEQLQILPAETQQCIVVLNDNLPQKELLVLNPLVAKLIEIQSIKDIKYFPIADDADKETVAKYKQNIALFKEKKKELIAVKKLAGEAKKAIKGPLDLLGKNVIQIEKSSLSIIEDVLKVIELEFKPFIDEEAEKAKLLLEKRNAESTKAIENLTEENKAQLDIIKKGNTQNFIKYEMMQHFTDNVNVAIEMYNVEGCQKLLDEIKQLTFENLTSNCDLTLFTTEEIENLKSNFNTSISAYCTNLNNRITSLESLREKELLENKIEVAKAYSPNALQNIDVVAAMVDLEGEKLAEKMNEHYVAAAVAKTPPYYPGLSLKENSIHQIQACIEAITNFVVNFDNDPNSKTAEDLEDRRRVTGSVKLLDKTILYVKNELTN